MSPHRILLLDDSATVLRLTATILTEAGFEVHSCDSPALFLSAIRKHRPHVILMDAEMPVVDGEQMISLVRKHNLTACPVLLYSSLPRERLEALAARCKASGYISKQSNGAGLLEGLRRHLPQAEAPAQL